jgi:hypothetical protein
LWRKTDEGVENMFCFHDWQEIEKLEMKEIIKQLHLSGFLVEYYDIVIYKGECISCHPNDIIRSCYIGDYYASRKICLKCGKCVDNIDEYKNKIMDHIKSVYAKRKKKVQRIELGKKMWENCKKEKVNG